MQPCPERFADRQPATSAGTPGNLPVSRPWDFSTHAQVLRLRRSTFALAISRQCDVALSPRSGLGSAHESEDFGALISLPALPLVRTLSTTVVTAVAPPPKAESRGLVVLT